jgi:hypothetical protein
MISRLAILLLFILVWPGAIAQKRVGTWRSHLPYNNASKIIIAGEKVFCSTDGGLFCFNKSDNSIEKISKENGLSDTDISALGYSKDMGITIIAYSNANVDLIQNNVFYNIPDIMRYTQILGDKQIYHISVESKFAYLSTGFGIVVIDLENKEISKTCIIGDGGSQVKVNSTCFNGNFLFAASDRGIYMADLSVPDLNLQDYHFWSHVTVIPNSTMKFNCVASVNNRVYASYQSGTFGGDVIYYWDGTSWNVFTPFSSDNCNHLSEWQGNLIVSATYHVHIYPETGDRAMVFINSPKCTYIDTEGVLWTADSEKGLVKRPLNEEILTSIIPNGPTTNYVSHIAISQGIVYTVPGGLKSDNNNQFRNGEINRFKDNSWLGYRKTQYKDYYRIAIDPTDPQHYFVASWGYGLFEYREDSLIEVYREGNSTLQSVIPGDFFRLGGLTFDNSGNLWITNSTVAKPLSVLKKNGEWMSYSLNNLITGPYMGDIIETQSGVKWIILPSGRGLFAMDDNRSIDNPDDDRYRRFDVRDEFNAVITNDVFSIAEDRDGNIWLGTNKGVLVYYNPNAVFEGENFYASQIIIPRNDGTTDGDPLLGTESVSSILVDGANRKWLGTKNTGVSLVSDDGLKQIHNFTAENSPLLSNSITSIAIDEKTGEVFFGTDNGIISYMAEATGPAENYDSIFVFPNPVRENFTGDIAINGLIENSLVKVTDLNGNLVYETISLGGQVLWDGKNFSGEKVSTGVYLVFCSSEDGLLSKVTKLLFIH